MNDDNRRILPSVDKVLQSLQSILDASGFSHRQIVDAVRDVLDEIRSGLTKESTVPSMEAILEQVMGRLEMQKRRGIHRVVNGTGIVLHTGLGRAVLPESAMENLAELDGCCNLQIDLETGQRGRRDEVAEELLETITGCEAATVVNNNAAATLLVLAALCKDREVIVSRGQLIEIGGSFRLPDVIAQSGAVMVEVGTTNKTHLRDYEHAIREETAVLLRVNPSNYRIVGFSQQVSTAQLATLKRDQNLIVVDDLGCGALVDLSRCGLPREPTVQGSLSQGADIALFSGDKLLGGPQSGIIVGKKEYVDRIRRHPLARAVRAGKFTIAALESTLKLFLNEETLWEKHPTLRMLSTPLDALQERAKDLAEKLNGLVEANVIEGTSACGGGALPTTPLPTALVSMKHGEISAAEFAKRLRLGVPCVVTRVQEEQVLVDVRTLLEGDEERIEEAVKTVLSIQ